MRSLRIIIRSLAVALALVTTATFAMIVYTDNILSDHYYIVEGNQLDINCQVPITVEYDDAEPSQKSLVSKGKKVDYSVNFKLLGMVPITNANVCVIDEMSVKVLGSPFGIKMYTDGVLVVGMGDVDGEAGNINPAQKAGIRVGDTIKSINGTSVVSNEDVTNIVEKSDGSELVFVIVRDKLVKEVKLQPVFSQSAGEYRIGLWVRDSTAGIGTLTFYSPTNGIISGLGHGVCDGDTDQLISMSSGEIVGAEILSCVKGSVGIPGELKGKLNSTLLGNMLLNDDTGVYAESVCEYGKDDLVNVAMKQEIENGPAYIFSTVNDGNPEYYSCEIELCANHESKATHNLIVKVTDQKLINATGGIVQGMSGSPILQNGKLIGAVTHVFVDDPTKGFGIFAENMLETAQSVAEEQLKKAS